MQDDQIIETYIPPPHPRGIELSGQWVRLEPLDISRHSKDLFQANTMDRDGSNWAYLPYGPFATLEAYETWLSEAALTPDPNFFAIIKRADNKAVGLASYLRINPQDGSNYCVRNLASPPACCKAYWPRAAIARQKPKAF